MSRKAWIIFGAICVALLGILVYASNKDKVDVSDIDVNTVLAARETSGNIADHVFGKKDSKVIFVEYGDFQCPGCGGAHPSIKAVTEKYKDQLAFVFRNFPITSLHPNARAAASAAEAAGLQGKYWEMHNKLFENQNSWGSLPASERMDFFTGYAGELGLATEKFASDMTGASVSKKINFDLALGKHVGVNSTPSFFLNGQKAEGIYDDQGNVDPKKLDEGIAKALKDAGIELPKKD